MYKNQRSTFLPSFSWSSSAFTCFPYYINHLNLVRFNIQKSVCNKGKKINSLRSNHEFLKCSHYIALHFLLLKLFYSWIVAALDEDSITFIWFIIIYYIVCFNTIVNLIWRGIKCCLLLLLLLNLKIKAVRGYFP